MDNSGRRAGRWLGPRRGRAFTKSARAGRAPDRVCSRGCPEGGFPGWVPWPHAAHWAPGCLRERWSHGPGGTLPGGLKCPEPVADTQSWGPAACTHGVTVDAAPMPRRAVASAQTRPLLSRTGADKLAPLQRLRHRDPRESAEPARSQAPPERMCSHGHADQRGHLVWQGRPWGDGGRNAEWGRGRRVRGGGRYCVTPRLQRAWSSTLKE